MSLSYRMGTVLYHMCMYALHIFLRVKWVNVEKTQGFPSDSVVKNLPVKCRRC